MDAVHLLQAEQAVGVGRAFGGRPEGELGGDRGQARQGGEVVLGGRRLGHGKDIDVSGGRRGQHRGPLGGQRRLQGGQVRAELGGLGRVLGLEEDEQAAGVVGVQVEGAVSQGRLHRGTGAEVGADIGAETGVLQDIAVKVGHDDLLGKVGRPDGYRRGARRGGGRDG